MSENETKKNPGKIICKQCPSVILLPNVATHTVVEKGIEMPLINDKDKNDTSYNFWTVNDMFAFENLGFCNTVKNVKYLACADCEIGPIGAHFIDQSKKIYYIALDRVKMLDS